VGRSKQNNQSNESNAPPTVAFQCKCGMCGCTVPELSGNDFGSLQANSRSVMAGFALQVVQVGDTHGIRFPREFGLLLKQLLYFDRYTQLLAPSLSVLNDDRVKIRQTPGPIVLDADEGNTITI